MKIGDHFSNSQNPDMIGHASFYSKDGEGELKDCENPKADLCVLGRVKTGKYAGGWSKGCTSKSEPSLKSRFKKEGVSDGCVDFEVNRAKKSSQ